MRITKIHSQLFRLPLQQDFSATLKDAPGNRHNHVFAMVVQVDTDAGLSGLGLSHTLHGGRALQALVRDDLIPLLLGEDPLDSDRLANEIVWRLADIGRRGLAMRAYAALDLALWDLKGKVAGLPLYKLLGAVRESAPAYARDTGWLEMPAEEIIDASRPLLKKGLMGIQIQVGGPNPETDAERVQQVREALGEDIWLGVDAGQRYDYGTALAMGRFLEEEMGVDWLESPLPCEDIAGHARLAAKLGVPLAVGAALLGRDEFQHYLERGAAHVLRPDIASLGGLTAWLKVAALADLHHLPLAPPRMPEVTVHLACSQRQVFAVEYTPWSFPLFREVPALDQGRLAPLPLPGLGLKLHAEAAACYRVDGD